MLVVTADQRRSIRQGDRVDHLLETLEPWVTAWSDHVALAPERTFGDEVQAVLLSAEATLDLSLALVRDAHWSVGIGTGPVDLPLRSTARASSGAAFVNARRAVKRARGRGEAPALVGGGGDRGSEHSATAMLQSLALVVLKRVDPVGIDEQRRAHLLAADVLRAVEAGTFEPVGKC